MGAQHISVSTQGLGANTADRGSVWRICGKVLRRTRHNSEGRNRPHLNGFGRTERRQSVFLLVIAGKTGRDGSGTGEYFRLESKRCNTPPSTCATQAKSVPCSCGVHAAVRTRRGRRVHTEPPERVQPGLSPPCRRERPGPGAQPNSPGCRAGASSQAGSSGRQTPASSFGSTFFRPPP